MAATRFEYVRNFEQPTTLLRNTWIVVRLDGHGFHRFSKEHQFAKPNDVRALHLMNASAAAVMREFDDIALAYGQSDEFSFVFRPSTMVYSRREAKIITNLCSLFTATFVMQWPQFFGSQPLSYAPSFDARAVCYPTIANLRDYMSWRQADCHINNLYNTAFWALVLDSKDPKTEQQAEAILRVTDSAAKNEILFTQFGINYNNIDPMFRKGSTLFWRKQDVEEVSAKTGQPVVRKRNVLATEYVDVIGESFWKENPHLLSRGKQRE
ncbi:tRNA-His guanylyltransferase [Polyrhizophydium stewartii]|uniref:tRNA(His) guanylyltransferase n=1 Tax=Polyrhizophydium stewartii TaxID=2732419 RepID=A0ABR4NH50_9FUNG|nr:tRNA-histidine guanylyltransferase 1-like [Polyrhizophydium stewartii]